MSFAEALDRHIDVFRQLPALAPQVAALAEDMAGCLDRGGKILFFGNGGSAADSQHLAAEFVVRFRAERRALPALALTVDSSVLTAQANDYSFDTVFARQVEALAQAADLVIGISTSGGSANVIEGLRAAGRVGARRWAWTGAAGARMADVADAVLMIPSEETARIQEAHLFIGHWLCEEMDRRFAGQ